MSHRALTPLPIDRFTVVRQEEGTVLVAEMSDFGPGSPLEQIYDDACDEGIAIQGRDRLVRFVLVKSHRDFEGELQFFELAPFPGEESVNCRVHLYND